MDPRAENSSLTLANGGGQVADNDIPKDGTGTLPSPLTRCWGWQNSLQDQGVVKLDPWLSPFQDALKRRFSKTQEWIKQLKDTEGGLDKFSKVSPRLRKTP